MSHNIELTEERSPDRTVWAINGVELAFDANDADDAERFEDAIEKMREEEKFPRVGKNSEIIRRYCQVFRSFFDRLFGDGTAERIGIKDNARICNNIYESFLLFVEDQKQDNVDFANRMKAMTPNREQKRAIAKSTKGKVKK